MRNGPCILMLLSLAGCSGGGELEALLNGAACGSVVELSEARYLEDVRIWQQCPADNRVRIVGVGAARPVIEGASGSTLRFYGSGYSFEHLEFTSPSDCDQAHAVLQGNGSYFDFVDVLVRGGGFDGIHTYCDDQGQANHIQIRDSEFARNGLGCMDGSGNILNGDGIDLFGCLDCEVRHTYVHGNNNYALQIKGGAARVTVSDSHLESRSQYGVVVGKPGASSACPGTDANAQDVTLRRNVIVMTDLNTWPIEIHDVSGFRAEHNTVVVRDNTNPDPSLNPNGESGGFVYYEATSAGGSRRRRYFFGQSALSLLPLVHFPVLSCSE